MVGNPLHFLNTELMYKLMDTQTDLPMPSNYAPKRRYRRSKRSTGAKRYTNSALIKRSRTTGENQIWPYRGMGLNQVFDPFPSQIRAKMRYCATKTLNPTLGVADHVLFRANGIFDPDQTGVGHQPYGHDTYQSIYNHYLVESATIVITPTENADGMIGCGLTDDTTVQANFDTIKEVKGTAMKAMGANGTPMNVVQYYNRNQIYNPHQEDGYAVFGQDPNELTYFHVWATAKDSTSSDTFTVNVSITYTVSMWELKDLGQS